MNSPLATASPRISMNNNQDLSCVAESLDPNRSTGCGWYSYDMGLSTPAVKTQVRAVYTLPTLASGALAWAIVPGAAGSVNGPCVYVGTTVGAGGVVTAWAPATPIVNTAFTNAFSSVRIKGCGVEVSYIGSTLNDQGYAQAYSWQPGAFDNNLPAFDPLDVNRFPAFNTRRLPTPLSWVSRPCGAEYYDYEDVDLSTGSVRLDSMSALALSVVGGAVSTNALRVIVTLNLEYSGMKDNGGLLGGLVKVEERADRQDSLFVKLVEDLPLNTMTNTILGSGKYVWDLTKKAAKALSMESLGRAAISAGLGYASGGYGGAAASAASSLLSRRSSKKTPKAIGFVPTTPTKALMATPDTRRKR